MNLSRTAEQCWVLGQVKLEMSDEISQTAAAELRHAEVIHRGQGVGLPHTGSHLSLHDACLLISEASLTNWLVVCRNRAAANRHESIFLTSKGGRYPSRQPLIPHLWISRRDEFVGAMLAVCRISPSDQGAKCQGSARGLHSRCLQPAARGCSNSVSTLHLGGLGAGRIRETGIDCMP